MNERIIEGEREPRASPIAIATRLPARDVYDDEISLVDLWIVFTRRKRLFWSCVGIGLALGVAAALVKGKQYAYTATIEIGTVVSPDGAKLDAVENPQAVLTKIQETYIPTVLSRYRAEQPDDEEIYEITARIPKSSDAIVLSAKGLESEGDTYKSLMTRVIDMAGADHSAAIEAQRRQAEHELAAARIALAELEDPKLLAARKSHLIAELEDARAAFDQAIDPYTAEVSRRELRAELEQERSESKRLVDKTMLISKRIERLDKLEELLHTQIGELEKQLEQSAQRRQQAVVEAADEARAMTLLLIDSDIENARSRLAGLQERLFIDVRDQREQLHNELLDVQRLQEVARQRVATLEARLDLIEGDLVRKRAQLEPKVKEIEAQIVKLEIDNRRAIERQQQVVEVMLAKVANVRHTQAVAPPVKSVEPVGVRRIVIALLGLIAGGLLGVFAVFAVEFNEKARVEVARRQRACGEAMTPGSS